MAFATAPASLQAGLGLIDLIQAMALARDLYTVMDIVRQGARRLVGADGVTFVLRDGELCHYADEDAISPLWKGQRFPMRTCISGWAMLNRQPAVIEDIYADPRIPHDAYRLTFVKSLVMVPVGREEPAAAIGAYWATRRRPTLDEVTLLETIATAAATALGTVDLIDGMRASIAELERAKERLEAANAAKSSFLAAASHDLRQPFQALRLFHHLMAEKGATPVLLDRIEQVLTGGEEMVEALLDVSALDTGRETPSIRPVALAEVLAGVGAEFADRAADKGLSLRVVPGRWSGRTDPALLARILRNFVANALKYTERGGVLVGQRRRGDEIAVEVWDSGRGIPAHSLDEVFEDFVQLGNHERDRRKGVGLGLGIARRTAQLLGHRLSVRSTPGRGSVFTIWVAAAD